MRKTYSPPPKKKKKQELKNDAASVYLGSPMRSDYIEKSNSSNTMVERIPILLHHVSVRPWCADIIPTDA